MSNTGPSRTRQTKKMQRPKRELKQRSAAAAGFRSWRPLRAGDLVDLVAPGFRTSWQEVEAAVATLKSWGLRVRVPKPLFGKDVVSSHRDEVRAAHLVAALGAPDSAAIWCLRGGYGSIRLLPYLDQLRPSPQHTKLFIGYSDVTTLHSYFVQKWHWAVVHGPLVNSVAKGSCDTASVTMLKQMIFAQRHEVVLTGLRALNAAARAGGSLVGPVVGGNATVVQSGIGTPYALSGKGRIVFFEDLGERGYRVDRILVHLEQSGFFKHCRAVIFGDFLGGHEEDGESRVPAVLARFAQAQSFPVLKGLPVGHGPRQMPLPLGTLGRLDLQKRTLTVDCGWRETTTSSAR